MRSLRLISFGKLHSDSFRTAQKHEFALMEVENLVARLDSRRGQPTQFSLQVLDREAHVVVADGIQPLDRGVRNCVRRPIHKELDLRAWYRTLQHHRHVLGLDAWYPHVMREDLARDH